MLINYPTARDSSKMEADIPHGFKEVLIDSGGFQLQQKTADVYLKGYGLWLQLMLPKHPEVVGYFNLEFKNPWDTVQNQLYLESEGLNPIPIWHVGEPEEILQMYADTHEWIAVGGIAAASVTGKQKLADLINWVMTNCSGNRVHVLGMGISGVTTFRTVKPYSTDFSTWSAVARFGHAIVRDKKNWVKEIKLPDEERARLRTDQNYLREVTLDGIRNLKEFENLINNYNITEVQKVML